MPWLPLTSAKYRGVAMTKGRIKRRIQRHLGLTSDGLIGLATLTAIEEALFDDAAKVTIGEDYAQNGDGRHQRPGRHSIGCVSPSRRRFPADDLNSESWSWAFVFPDRFVQLAPTTGSLGPDKKRAEGIFLPGHGRADLIQNCILCLRQLSFDINVVGVVIAG